MLRYTIKPTNFCKSKLITTRHLSCSPICNKKDTISSNNDPKIIPINVNLMNKINEHKDYKKLTNGEKDIVIKELQRKYPILDKPNDKVQSVSGKNEKSFVKIPLKKLEQNSKQKSKTDLQNQNKLKLEQLLLKSSKQEPKSTKQKDKLKNKKKDKSKKKTKKSNSKKQPEQTKSIKLNIKSTDSKKKNNSKKTPTTEDFVESAKQDFEKNQKIVEKFYQARDYTKNEIKRLINTSAERLKRKVEQIKDDMNLENNIEIKLKLKDEKTHQVDRKSLENFAIAKLPTMSLSEFHKQNDEKYAKDKDGEELETCKNLDLWLEHIKNNLQIFEPTLQFHQQYPSKINTFSNIEVQNIISNHDKYRKIFTKSDKIFTIDPETAKDLDDAIHFNCIDEAKQIYELGVHIADVTNFINLHENPNLMEHVLKTVTSHYWPDRTLHMLPTDLSADLCSLNLNGPKLAMSMTWKFQKGEEFGYWSKPFDFWFGPSIIEVHSGLHYDEVTEMLSLGPLWKITDRLENITQNLRDLDSLTKNIDTTYEDMNLDLSKTKQIFYRQDDKIVCKDEKLGRANKIVQTCMLLANEYAGDIINDNKIIRTHTGLESDKASIIHALCHNYKFPKIVKELYSNNQYAKMMTIMNNILDQNVYQAESATDRDDFSHFNEPSSLVHLFDSDYEEFNSIIIKSDKLKSYTDSQIDKFTHSLLNLLVQAEYTEKSDTVVDEKNITSHPNYHVGVGRINYSHFTSPIRRCADILVHSNLKLLYFENPQNFIPENNSNTESINQFEYEKRLAIDNENNLTTLIDDYISEAQIILKDKKVASSSENFLINTNNDDVQVYSGICEYISEKNTKQRKIGQLLNKIYGVATVFQDFEHDGTYETEATVINICQFDEDDKKKKLNKKEESESDKDKDSDSPKNSDPVMIPSSKAQEILEKIDKVKEGFIVLFIENGPLKGYFNYNYDEIQLQGNDKKTVTVALSNIEKDKFDGLAELKNLDKINIKISPKKTLLSPEEVKTMDFDKMKYLNIDFIKKVE